MAVTPLQPKPEDPQQKQPAVPGKPGTSGKPEGLYLETQFSETLYLEILFSETLYLEINFWKIINLLYYLKTVHLELFRSFLYEFVKIFYFYFKNINE